MKKILIILPLLWMTSCIDQIDRLNDAQKKYPKCIVQPTTSLLSRNGYDIMVEDTFANQIYVLRYYPFSTSKVADIRNIK